MNSKRETKGSRRAQAQDEQSHLSPALPPWQPRCVYFYYLVPHDQYHADVKGFIYDRNQILTDATVDGLIPSFVTQARGGAYANLVPVAHFFEDVTWVRQSYVVIAVDQRFILSRSDIWDSAHTLLDKTPILNNSGVRYRHYVVRKNSQTWRRDKREKEQLWIELEFRARSAKLALQAASHDDSGTNLGPPLSPP